MAAALALRGPGEHRTHSPAGLSLQVPRAELRPQPVGDGGAGSGPPEARTRGAPGSGAADPAGLVSAAPAGGGRGLAVHGPSSAVRAVWPGRGHFLAAPSSPPAWGLGTCRGACGKLPLRACPGAGTALCPLAGPLEAAARLGGSRAHRALRPQSPGPEHPGLRRPPPAPGLRPEGCRAGPRAPRYRWAGQTPVGGRHPNQGWRVGRGHPARCSCLPVPTRVSGRVAPVGTTWPEQPPRPPGWAPGLATSASGGEG